MKQLAVISGKGGTGKTTLVASFAYLAGEKAVIADCDVDAPDLHLLLKPNLMETREFFGMKKAKIDYLKCNHCGECEVHCRFGAICEYEVNTFQCEGCAVCKLVCSIDAVEMIDHISGHAYISETRFGPMVHADLIPGEENSGKLVAMVREMARDLAESLQKELVLIDGSPGIGCPVIASITGADFVLVVCEPTISGVHDLGRIVAMTQYFEAKTLVCINKYDLNPEVSKDIEERCRAWAVEVVGRVPYDQEVIESIVSGVTVIEERCVAGKAIQETWENIEQVIN